MKRNWTKVGFYVDFEVPKNLAPLDMTIFKHFPIEGPTIESDDIELYGGAILWGKDGYIDCIEMFCFGDFFNKEIHEFNLYDMRQKRENKV